MMKIPRKKVKGNRARPQTSRYHKLKAIHYHLWCFYWERSRVLPEETYIEFQSAAAKHFHVNQSTISRRLAVLIEHEAVVVVHKRERGASHFWTSQVIRPTEPPRNYDAFEAFSVSLLAKANVEQVVDNTGSSSTFTFASGEAHSVLTSNDNHIRTPDDKDIELHTTLSDAKVNVDGGCVNTGASLLAKVHVEGAVALGDRIVAAHQKLEEYERAAVASAATGNDGCWDRSITNQRGMLARLRQEYAALKGEKQ